jgi:hypothetical protein
MTGIIRAGSRRDVLELAALAGSGQHRGARLVSGEPEARANV